MGSAWGICPLRSTRPPGRAAGDGPRAPSALTRPGPAVQVLRTPAAAIAEPDLDAPDLVEAAEVALRGSPAHPGHLRDLRGGHLLPAGGEQPLDGLQRVGGPALRVGQLVLGPQRAEDPVDVALVGLVQRVEAGPHLAVGQQLVAQRREAEGFEQVVQGAALHGRADAVGVLGRGDDDDVHRRVPFPAQPGRQLQAVLVRQVQVQQQQVRVQPVHRCDGFGRRMRLGDRLEALDFIHVGGMDAGHAEIVIDGHHADHGKTGAFPCEASASVASGAPGPVLGSTPTQLGSTAVKTAPVSWPTLTIPPRPSATFRTSASPSPRRAPVAEVFVVTPSMKMASRILRGTPRPESRTRISRSCSAATIVSSTHRGSGAWAAASIALSMRFPATVSTWLTSLTGPLTWLSSMTRSRTSRSSASETFPRISATSLASPMSASSRSVRSARAAETSVTNWIASSLRPS